jgi:tripartite ATP-independent transporter DctP family solute receptor
MLTLVFLFLVGCSGNSSSASPASGQAAASESENVSYSLAHHMTLDHAVQTYCVDFANIIKEKTGGKVIVEVFGGGQIGGLKDNTDALRYNTLEFAIVDLPTIATVIPQTSLISLPYLFKNLDHVERFYDSAEFQKLNEIVREKASTRILGNSHIGWRVVVGNKAIRKVSDFKNLKISSPDKPINVQTMTTLGANPTVVSYGENYTSLQTGIIDAADQTPDSFYAARLHEITKYVSCTDHIYVDVCLGTSEQFFQTLSSDLQTIIQEAAKTATKRHRELVHDAYNEAMAKVLDSNKNMERINLDLAPFRDAVKSVTEQFLKENPDMKATIDYINSLS